MGNKLTYILIAAGIGLLAFLNPNQDQHRRAFMDYAHAHFFELSAGYRDIYEQLRDESLRHQGSSQLRFGNFLLFSTLNHTRSIRMPHGGFRQQRRPLTVGVLGFVLPVTLEPSALEQPAIEQ